MSMGRLTKKRTGAFYLTNLLLTVVLFVVLYLLIDGKVLTGRYTTLITLVCVNVILAVSLNLVTGILGQLVLGHAGFMLVGAYVSALFTKTSAWRWGFPSPFRWCWPGWWPPCSAS